MTVPLKDVSSTHELATRPDCWRINDAAKKLSVSRSTLYSLASEGKLKLVKVAGRSLIPDAEIRRLANGGA
jgi:excisionase family DNA binding protein